MKLVETKCPNCNSHIKVEPRKKICCEYCGAPISVNETKCSRCGVEIEFEKE